MEVEKKQNPKWVPGKFIGRGSYGSVCIGVRESDGGCFAVKSASKDSLSSLEALENEIEVVRSLSSSSPSPFIVEYYGDDETASQRSLQMEYLPGGDVAKSGKVGDVELIRSYTWCLVMALKEVHSRGIVHCDVKGSNVLLGPTPGVVKLSDFGSSKIITDESGDQRVKIVPRGSPLWMAPEVVRGESQGCESDIWSLGCTVIEMFTGVPAWQDCGAHTLLKIGYSDDLPEYPAQLSEVGRDFLGKCLNRNPGQRWSCDQLLQHPFLLPVSSINDDSTPRSILDWQNLDFSDDDDDQEYPSSSSSLFDFDQIDEVVVSAKDRIGNLATTSGVNWESEGWVEVRSLANHSSNKQEVLVEEEKQSVSEGTSLEYTDSRRVEWEIQENDYITWINLSVDNDNDDEEDDIISGGDGVERCGHGDSFGGVNKLANKNPNFEKDVKVLVELSSLLLLFSSLLLLHVLLYSSRRNKITSKENGCYIVLQFLVTVLKFLTSLFILFFQAGILEQVN